ncbi:MAG: preprotein translocase subunit SecE [Patescibacteria group bacterium]
MEEESVKSGIKNYIVGSVRELTKVTWPTKNQAITMSAVVLIFVFVGALILAGVDFSFNKAYLLFLDFVR